MSTPRSDPRRRRRRTVALVAACTALSGVSAAAALAASSSGTSPPPAEGAAPASSADAADTASFAILRRAPTAADAIAPRDPVMFSGASGANAVLARRVVGLAGATAWVVPGSGVVCIEAESQDGVNGGAACVPDAQAAHGWLEQQASSAQLPGVVLVSGLVPDGTAAVTVRLADGSTQALPIVEGVYAQELRGTVTAVTVAAPTGAVTMTPPAAASG